jgi:hypothetical protein
MLSVSLSQLSVLVAAYLYTEYAEAEEGQEKFESEQVWAVAIGMVGLWAVMFLGFMGLIVVPKHRHTFWGSRSGVAHTQGYFLDNEADEKKALIFDVRWTLAALESPL